MPLSEFHSVVDEFFTTQGWSAPAVLIKTFSVYNPDTSENSVGEERIDVRVIVTDYLSKTNDANSLIKTGDKHVLMSPAEGVTKIDPTKDILLLDNEQFKIITARQFAPNISETLYYELYVRL